MLLQAMGSFLVNRYEDVSRIVWRGEAQAEKHMAD